MFDNYQRSFMVFWIGNTCKINQVQLGACVNLINYKPVQPKENTWYMEISQILFNYFLNLFGKYLIIKATSMSSLPLIFHEYK